MAALPLAVFAGLLVEMQKQDVQWKTNKFIEYGQFAPKYVAFSHEEMMFECDKRNLVYDYEESQCKYLTEDSL